MSWIKEARELVQDLIAPELRAIGLKMDGLAARMEEQAQWAEKRDAERHLEMKSDLAALRTG
ncbi:MAG TPA: hypothetical protein VGD62_01085 [Acidobacteriaceae bacterium]